MVQARPNPPSLDVATASVPDTGGRAEIDWAEPDWDLLTEEWESDEPTLESDLHRDTIDLLVRSLRWAWRDRPDFYVSGNTTVYFDQSQKTNRNFRGPDFYVVLGAEKRDRKSWMIWREGGRYPNIVVEVLSDSTAGVDRTTKKALYQDTWRLPDYFLFHPRTQEFQGFRLEQGRYQALQPNRQGQLWSEELQLWIGVWGDHLRFFLPTGDLVLLEEEARAQEAEQERQRANQQQQRAEQAQQQAEQAQQRAEQAQQQAEQAQQRAEQERQRAERLAAQLKAAGIEPTEL